MEQVTNLKTKWKGLLYCKYKFIEIAQNKLKGKSDEPKLFRN